MIRAAAVAVCLIAAACTPASAESVAPGIYGDVRLSEESGDLGGMELELIGTGTDARVEFVLCEGWCNEVGKAPVRFTAEGFRFDYVQHYVNGDGSPAPSGRYDVEATPLATGLRVKVTPADNPQGSFSADLPRIERRFGLAVAAGE